MTENSLLVDAITRIFRDFYKNDVLNSARRNGWCPELWSALEQAGMTLVSVPEENGGTGGSIVAAAEVLRLSGKYCASVPLAESAFLGGWALSEGGVPIPDGPMTFTIVKPESELAVTRLAGDSWRLAGCLTNVPWARHAKSLILLHLLDGKTWVLVVPADEYEASAFVNIAGEARDQVKFKDACISGGRSAVIGGPEKIDEANERGALARSLQMCGALEQVLELTLKYTNQRSQFGKPIIKFQAVQQELARLAGDVAIAKACALSAAGRVQEGRASTSVATAKVKVGEAAYSGAAIGHQLHGAIGVTDEYLLHHSTLRLLAWRSEYGSEAVWAEKLGDHALNAGAKAIWNEITSTNDAA